MSRERLERLIEKLHNELGTVEALDDDTRAELRELADDIEKIAERGAADEAQRRSVIDQLEERALGFESEHPRLSLAMREVMDALGRLGI